MEFKVIVNVRTNTSEKKFYFKDSKEAQENTHYGSEAGTYFEIVNVNTKDGRKEIYEYFGTFQIERTILE